MRSKGYDSEIVEVIIFEVIWGLGEVLIMLLCYC